MGGLPSREEIIKAKPNKFSESQLQKIERYLYKTAPPVINIKNLLPRTMNTINADITRLDVDMIVNAANKELLGCFQPNHKCVDNVIHSRAGPRMRDECYALRSKGYGDPLVTHGYCLPCKWVCHVVGPVWDPNESKKCDMDLESTYLRALNAANNTIGVKSVAFPAISTGLFRFPINRAQYIVDRVIKHWFFMNPESVLSVLLVTFG